LRSKKGGNLFFSGEANFALNLGRIFLTRRPAQRNEVKYGDIHLRLKDSAILTISGLKNMQRIVVRSKIHKATVTNANLEYIGSITIDRDLLEKADLWPGEKVLVVSNTTGARLETYIIEGEAGSGCICINGGAAHLIQPGEEVIIMAFAVTAEPVEPIFILVDADNRFVRYL
jgi:aspartate 1-decarboxylase